MRHSKRRLFPAAAFLFVPTLLGFASPARAQYSFTDVDVPGAIWTAPSKINDAGEIVGQYLDPSNHRHGFLFSGGTYTTIDCPAPYTAQAGAFGINNSGQIVGFCAAPGGINGVYGSTRSFILDAGALTLLPDIGSSYLNASTFAEAINDSGQIVGWYADACLCFAHGFSYQSGVFATLAVPGYGSTIAYDVNNAGQVTGSTQPGFGTGGDHGFLLSGGVYTLIDDPDAGGNATDALGLNGSGQIVGQYWDSGNVRHGFILSNGQFSNVDHPAANGLSEASGINSTGSIIGAYVDASNVLHGFIGIPTPSDTTAPVLTVPGAMSVAATSASGAVVAYSVTASDPDDAAGPVACTPASGSTFPIGTTTVNCSSTDSHGNTGSASFTVTVGYNVCVLYNTAQAFKSGSTIPIKLQLCGAGGTNISSASVTLSAVRLVYLSTSASSSVQDAGNANPDSNFRFDATLGGSGGYIFNLQTKGLASGTYSLEFTVAGDPVSHSTPFQVR